MKYISMDIETTGLDESFCQILEIGAIIANTNLAEEEDFPAFCCRFYYDKVIGEPYALHMHAEIIKDMETRPISYRYLHPDSFWHYFTSWLENNLRGKATLAGKNLGSFDLRFLRKLPRWNENQFSNRVLDPGTLYFDPDTDTCLPDLKTCLKRAAIEFDPLCLHSSLVDARMVINLIRAADLYNYNRLKEKYK